MSEKRIEQRTEEVVRVLALVEGMRGVIRRGWCKGRLAETREGVERQNGYDAGVVKVCLLGGMEKVTGRSHEEEGDGVREVKWMIYEEIERGIDAEERAMLVEEVDAAIADWNDRPERSRSMVLRMLGRVVRRARQRIGMK